MAARLLGELGLDAGSQVLLTGDSAGGVGCLNNADWLYDMLQCAPSKNCQELGCAAIRMVWQQFRCSHAHCVGISVLCRLLRICSTAYHHKAC